MSMTAFPAGVSRRLVLVAAVLAGVAVQGPSALAATHKTSRHAHQGRPHSWHGVRPTVVLVHGAWADASSWNPVAARLMDDGFKVIAPANPLRGVKSDSEYLKSVLATISGPVVLVGHSYGGVVATDAATGDTNVKALVFIAAFAPEEGESAGEIEARNPGSEAGGENLETLPYPGGVDIYIKPSAFHRVFCADVPEAQAALMAAEQRPLSANAFGEPSSAPAWKTIPSWYMVASEDHAIPPATERFMAKRAHSHTVEVQSSHVAMLSHPEAATKLILDAAYTAG